MKTLFVLSVTFVFSTVWAGAWRAPVKHLDQSHASRKTASAGPCTRFSAGSVVHDPVDLFSQNGKLEVSLAYLSNTNEDNNIEFCYLTPDGTRSPTLHVKPGDTLTIHLTNRTLASSSASAMQMDMSAPGDASQNCGPASMYDGATTNMHFHGLNVPPVCTQDDAIHTLINAGQTYTYEIHLPADEPPGLYWYHPHIHGISENAVLRQ